jgi:hypothetical protein
VWAADAEWLRNRFETKHPTLHAVVDKDRNFKMDPYTFPEVFRQEQLFVLPVSAYHLNERLIKQQGVFLCPGAIRCPLEDNVAALQYDDSGSQVPNVDTRLIKFEISTAPETRADILKELRRMNMSTATLYPGIQGFARSLENMLVFPDILEYGPEYDNDLPLWLRVPPNTR